MADLRRLAERIACVATLASLAYGAFALGRVVAFGKRSAPHVETGLGVTILKPLHGDEPLLEEKLRSFCEQDYPSFDVVLGARDAADPALSVARRLAGDAPARVRVVSADATTPQYANPKIDTLAAMIPHALGDVLVIADSDMRVGPDYLQHIVAPFADPHVGAVTALYRGEPLDGFASVLGAMGNHEHFAPSVLVAKALGPLRYCFGATMAVRRELFEAFGGLEALGSHLADDARLGELVAAQGFDVVLSDYVVENVVAEPTLHELWSHEVRWARTHRTLRPAGYAGLVLTYPVPLALLYFALARRRGAALGLTAAAFALRYALAFAARRAFGVRAPATPSLVPLRDAFGIAVWAAAFASRSVRWSGERFMVGPDGEFALGEYVDARAFAKQVRHRADDALMRADPSTSSG